MIDFTPALPTFVITLREGVEAALVVGLVLAYLNKAQQQSLIPWVWNGVIGGLVASGGVGLLFAAIFQWVGTVNPAYAPVLKPLLEAVFSIAAIAMLSWMLIWMTRQSRVLKSQVEGAIQSTLAGSAGAGWGVWTLIFFAVLREGFETVLFLAAKFQQGIMPIAGAIAGLSAAVLVGVLLFQVGIKINLKVFFQAMGVFLLLIVAGLVVSSLVHLDLALTRLATLNPAVNLCFGHPAQLGGSCILGTQLWDTHALLPERQFPGIILHTLFGYEDQVYWLEAIAYSGFLLGIGTIYLRSLGGQLVKTASPTSVQSSK